MRAIRHVAGWIVGLGTAATLLLVAWALLRGRPQDLPWTPLDLGQPVGLFTGAQAGRRSATISAQCRALLDRAGVRYTVLPPRRDSPQCGYADGVRLTAGRRAPDRLCATPASAWPARSRRRSRCGNGMSCSLPRNAASAAASRRSSISAATIAAASTAATAAPGASMPPPMRSTSPVSGWRTAPASPSLGDWRRRGQGRLPARRPRRRLQAVRDDALAGLQRRPRRSPASRSGEPRRDGLARMPLGSGR